MIPKGRRYPPGTDIPIGGDVGYVAVDNIGRIIQAPAMPVPVLTTLTPNTASIAAGGLGVAIFGSDFDSSAVVYADGVAQSTNYAGPQDLSVSVFTPGGAPRTIQVTVHQGSQISNALPFTATA